jgi:hypothetical protein
MVYLLALGLSSSSPILLPHLPVKLCNIVDGVSITNMKLAGQGVIDNPIKEPLSPEDAIDNVVVNNRKKEPADGACNDLLPRVIVQVDAMKEMGEIFFRMAIQISLNR